MYRYRLQIHYATCQHSIIIKILHSPFNPNLAYNKKNTQKLEDASFKQMLTAAANDDLGDLGDLGDRCDLGFSGVTGVYWGDEGD